MKAKELQKLTKKELEEKLHELKTNLIKERAQAARGIQTKNPKLIKKIRKNIARCLASLTRKEKRE